jgi:hypothetical protein
MGKLRRSLGVIGTSMAILLLGGPAVAPTAQAAEPVTISGTALSASGGACSSGSATLYLWYQPSGSAAYFESYDDGTVSGGAYSFTVSSSYAGRIATVSVDCNDGNSFPRWFGGSLVRPTALTAANSTVLVEGANDFGSLAVVPGATVSGKIYQSDGSVLPATDKLGLDAWLRVYERGADTTRADSITSCGTDTAGVFSNCSVPVGTYDVQVLSEGYGDFVYPQTEVLNAGFVVPAAGASGLALRTAVGPAAKLRGSSVPTIAGVPVVGNYLAANPGVWSDKGYEQTEMVVGYQWLVGGVVRSTAAVYQVQAQDAGQAVVVKVLVTRPLFASAEASSAAVVAQAAPDTRVVSQVAAKFAKLKKNKKSKVAVSVSAAVVPAGVVTVSEGKTLLGKSWLKNKNLGKVKLTIKGLKKGTHTLTIVFGGNTIVKSVTRVVTVKVK